MTLKTNCPREAGRIIREGGIVAFPTETVFGLGVDATKSSAVEKLFEAKGRPSDNPLIVHVSEFAMWQKVASTMTPQAKTLLEAFAPGPITVVLPKADSISKLVTAGLDSVGLRMPSHPIAAQILKEAQVPVAAPSANLSGRPSSTTWKSVLEDLEGRIDAVFCEDCSNIGIESTVVDCRGEVPVVLRPGAISIEQIQELIADATELASSKPNGQNDKGLAVHSPGLLHPHYQPNAKVHLIDFSTFDPAKAKSRSAYCGVHTVNGAEGFSLLAIFETIEEYAAGFYEFLRDADRQGIADIYIEQAPDSGLGRALLDRQRRAANNPKN